MSNPAHSNGSAGLTKLGNDLRQATERVTRLEKQTADLRNHKASFELRISNLEDALSDLRSFVDEKFTELFGALETAESLYDAIASELGLDLDSVGESDGSEEEHSAEDGQEGEEAPEQLELTWDESEAEEETETKEEDYQVGDLEGEEIG